MILVACGLKREAAIIARAGWTVVAGGGDSARLEAELEARVAGATVVLSCGVAGALDPALKAGDVVIGTLFRHPGEGRGLLVAEAGLADEEMPWPESQRGSGLRRDDDVIEWLARDLPQAKRGTVIGTDTIIASPAEKTALHLATGALAVDMESHIAARVAARHGLPFAILRTISDSADHALPLAALVGMRADGGVALGAVLASLAHDLRQLPALIRTGRDAAAAFNVLERSILTIAQFDFAVMSTPGRP